MNKLLQGTIALVAFAIGGPANAADMPVKAPPAQAPVFSWTGCYLGGNVGGGWGTKEVSHADGSGGILDSSASVSDHTSGFLGGGQVGCDYQAPSNWLIGVEGSVSFGDVHGDASTSIGTVQGSSLGTLNFQAKTDWIASLTGRVGYTWTTWLLYVKGGVAWAHDKYGGNGSNNLLICEIGGACSIENSFPFGPINATETRVGWTIGTGAEYELSRNWSAKIEYDFYDFGGRDVAFTNAAGDQAPSSFSLHVDQQIHTVKLGLNYRLN